MEVETPLAEMPPPSAATAAAAAVSNGDSGAAVEGNGEAAAAEGGGDSSNGGVEQPYQGKVGAKNVSFSFFSSSRSRPSCKAGVVIIRRRYVFEGAESGLEVAAWREASERVQSCRA